MLTLLARRDRILCLCKMATKTFVETAGIAAFEDQEIDELGRINGGTRSCWRQFGKSEGDSPLGTRNAQYDNSSIY